MHSSPALRLFLLAALAGALPGCAEQGSFPSLLPRPIELAETAPEPAPPAPEGPADPVLVARLAQIVAQAREGQQAFESRLGATRTAVANAGGAGSDSWVEGQQALSRLESARSPTLTALGDIDVLALQRNEANEANEADRAAIAAAMEEIQSLAQGQRDEISRLTGLLPPA